MGRPSLQIEMKFDHLHCYEEGDGIGSSEAYLWIIYFKIDGDSVYLGDDLFLHGNCTLIATPGSHGNLGDSDIDAGDDVPIPSAIGEFHGTLNAIPVPQWVRDQGVDDVGGVVGVACVLMEENWVSDSGAEAGHTALNNYVRQAIDDIIPTLGITNQDVSDDQLNQIASGASDAVSNAIENAQGVWDNITSWIHGDKLLGTATFIFKHDDLLTDAFKDMEHRFQQFITLPRFPTPILVADFELFGQMQGIQSCPVNATSVLVQSQKWVSEKNITAFMNMADKFKRNKFAGSRGLAAWWQLAERNIASIMRLLLIQPKVSKKHLPSVLAELVKIVEGRGKVSEEFVSHMAALLELFVAKGSRRLRIDAAIANRTLQTLGGKPFDTALDLLRKQSPSRFVERTNANRKSKRK